MSHARGGDRDDDNASVDLGSTELRVRLAWATAVSDIQRGESPRSAVLEALRAFDPEVADLLEKKPQPKRGRPRKDVRAHEREKLLSEIRQRDPLLAAILEGEYEPRRPRGRQPDDERFRSVGERFRETIRHRAILERYEYWRAFFRSNKARAWRRAEVQRLLRESGGKKNLGPRKRTGKRRGGYEQIRGTRSIAVAGAPYSPARLALFVTAEELSTSDNPLTVETVRRIITKQRKKSATKS